MKIYLTYIYLTSLVRSCKHPLFFFTCLQVDIVKTCRELGVKPKGFYRPGYEAGSKLRLQMMCLGRNWDPQTKYGKNVEIDSEPPNIPDTFSVLVEQAIREAHALVERESETEDAESILPMMSPDICIANFYIETGRLGLHQVCSELLKGSSRFICRY